MTEVEEKTEESAKSKKQETGTAPLEKTTLHAVVANPVRGLLDREAN